MTAYRSNYLPVCSQFVFRNITYYIPPPASQCNVSMSCRHLFVLSMNACAVLERNWKHSAS
uniref:Uncharacterized protein n=1 Tax=Anguilla anguilla TaxID=7936 RepID=A0A0E9SRP5_ANGAN